MVGGEGVESQVMVGGWGVESQAVGGGGGGHQNLHVHCSSLFPQ